MYRVILLVGFLAAVEATARFNSWGWAYDNGAPISRERRINIVTQMLINGGNAVAAAAFVKVVPNTARKWWRRWLHTGDVEVSGGRRGPAPVLNAACLLYLLCISEMHRKWSLAQYSEHLYVYIGVVATERVVCAALKRLGQHRKAVSIKKVESLTPHGEYPSSILFSVHTGHQLPPHPIPLPHLLLRL